MPLKVLAKIKVRELLRKTWHEVGRNRCLGRAAELGFFFMMSLFPFLIFLISFLSFVPGARDLMLGYFSRFAPPQVMQLLQAWIEAVINDRSGGLLSFGLLFSLWAASGGTAALIDLLNIAYDVAEGRSFWKSRWVATWLTLVLTLLVMGGALIVIFGQRLLRFGLTQTGFADSFPRIGYAFSYVTGLAMVVVGLAVIYYVGPNVKLKWRWVIPGSLFALVFVALVSYGFSYYLKVVPSFNLTYGSLGAAVVLMLWLYLVSLMILIGGEMNAEIFHAAKLPIIEKEPSHKNSHE